MSEEDKILFRKNRDNLLLFLSIVGINGKLRTLIHRKFDEPARLAAAVTRNGLRSVSKSVLGLGPIRSKKLYDGLVAVGLIKPA